MKKLFLFIVFMIFTFNVAFAQFFFKPVLNKTNKKTKSDNSSSTEKIDKVNKRIEDGTASEDDYVFRGETYLKNKKYDDAIKDFSSAINLNNFSLAAYVGRAEAYFESGNTYYLEQDLDKIFNGVIFYLNKGAFNNPFWKRAYTLRGKLNEKNEDYNAAEADYKTAENF